MRLLSAPWLLACFCGVVGLTLAPSVRAQGGAAAPTSDVAPAPITPVEGGTPAAEVSPAVTPAVTPAGTAALPAAVPVVVAGDVPVALPAAAAPVVDPTRSRRSPTAGPQLEGPRDGRPDCRVDAALCMKNDLFALWPRLRLRTGYEFVQPDSQILTVGQNDGFFLDQTRIGVDAAFKDDLRFRLILDVATPLPGGAPNDPVQSINAAVRDAWVAWLPSDWFFVSVGQQFIPSDLEGSSTLAGLPFARRSVATSGMRAGHGFAVGGLSPPRQMALVMGSTENARFGSVGVEYLLGVGNGNGQNILGNDNKLPAAWLRLGVSFEDMVRIGVGGRHNPRTVGTLPNLFNEFENAGFADASVKLAGLSASGQVIYKQTTFATLFPDGGDGSSDTGLGITAWVYADEPFGIDLCGLIPAYRFSYYDPSSTFADDQIMENTLGLRWDVPVEQLPLSVFVDGTLPTEFGDGVRDLDNARITALLQLEL